MQMIQWRAIAAVSAALAISSVFIGCSGAGEQTPGSGPGSGEQTNNATAQDLGEAELRELVDQYLNLHTDRAGIDAVKQRIRSLNRAQARSFGMMVLEMGNADAPQRALSEAALLYAEEKGISFLDLNRRDGREIMARVTGLPIGRVPLDEPSSSTPAPSQLPSAPEGVGVVREAACSFGYVACSYTTAWNSAVGLTSCSSGCTPGSGWDNVSNSSCEFYSCDTRIWAPRASAQYIDGATPAADCVITYYGALSKYSSGGYTYVGYGIGGPAYCLFFPTNPAGYYVLK